MDGQFLEKRINEMETDIFPLDRLANLEAIYQIFNQEYVKTENKSTFLKDRNFQRLREGYFAMFVAISLQDDTTDIQYLLFPSSPDNDVYIGYWKNVDTQEKPKIFASEFDIKEYTDWSPDFTTFFNESIVSKINIYNIAIATYRGMDGNDLQIIINYLNSNLIDKRIWLLGLPNEEEEDYNISKVTIVSKNGIEYEKTLNLLDWVDKTKTPMIYQDVVRFK